MSSRRQQPKTRSRQSYPKRVPREIPAESMDMTQSPFMAIPIENLHRGFAEVQKKFSQLLNVIDRNENVGMMLESFGSLTVGIQSLRDIAAAIIEKDPHFACINKVFEDLWLLGFTRPLKLCNKFENSGKATDSCVSFRAWRTGFMLDWQGYLCNLRDTLKLYSNPVSAMRLLPTLRQSLPVQFTCSDSHLDPLNHLPLNYLLRDIALCLARTFSHENLELEKIWMKRAVEINGLLGGLPYKDAWEHLLSKSEKEKSRATPQSPMPLKILGRYGGRGSPTLTEFRLEDVESQFPLIGEAEMVEKAEKKKEKSGGGEYGAVVASQRDLQVMRMFKQRNAFIQGLLQAAEDQGQISLNDPDDDLGSSCSTTSEGQV